MYVCSESECSAVQLPVSGIPICHRRLNSISHLHTHVIVASSRHQVSSHTQFEEYNRMEIRLYLENSWLRHFLYHVGFMKLCLQYIRDVASPVYISKGDMQSTNTPKGHVIHALILLAVQINSPFL